MQLFDMVFTQLSLQFLKPTRVGSDSSKLLQSPTVLPNLVPGKWFKSSLLRFIFLIWNISGVNYSHQHVFLNLNCCFETRLFLMTWLTLYPLGLSSFLLFQNRKNWQKKILFCYYKFRYSPLKSHLLKQCMLSLVKHCCICLLSNAMCLFLSIFPNPAIPPPCQHGEAHYRWIFKLLDT